MRTKNLFTLLLALIAVAALSACGGGGGGSGATTITPITYSISGTVTQSGVGGLAGVTINLVEAGLRTTTDGSGNYSFTGLSYGSYTIVPSLSGYVFNPPSLTRTISGANVTGADFTATPVVSTHSISGQITLSSVGLAGVTVTLVGPGTTTTTDSSGNYSFAGLADGSYTVQPSLSGYTFTPANRTVVMNGLDMLGINFTATAVPTTYSLSGTITASGIGLAGVTVTLNTGPMAVTDASGFYNFTGLAPASYTITPTLTGYTFSPTSLNRTITNANITGADFTAAVVTPTYSILGTVTTSTGVPLANVTMTLSTGTVVTTNGTGAYQFNGLANGTYTITPSRAGYTFNPINTLQIVSGANVSGVNFTATPVVSTHIISGTITASGAGLAGVTVSLFGTSITTTTNGSGSYTFTNLADGPYTISPSKFGYTFSPSSSSQTLSGVNLTGINFTAIPTRVTVKLSTAGSFTQSIGAVEMVLQLPAGVSVKSTIAPPETDPGVAFQSGNAATSEIFSATYTSATRTLLLNLGHTTGFASGEFATVLADLTGVMPLPTDFTVLSFKAWGTNTALISAATSTIALSSSPVHARVTLSTSGTTTTIGGVDVTIGLPVNVTARSTLSPPKTDPGVVFASGNAASNSIVEGLYTSATRTVRAALINANGFTPGQFATVICDLANGATPTAGDFTVLSATVSSLSSASTITGAGVTVGVTLE